MSEEVIVDALPNCDLCAAEGVKKIAHYDAATRMGSWANLCEEHFARYAYGLGTGRGQRLILKEDN